MSRALVPILAVLAALLACGEVDQSTEAANTAADSTSASEEPQGGFSEAQQAAVTRFRDGVYASLRPCDEVAGKIATASQAGDPVGLYRAAEDTRTICRPIALNLAGLDVPAVLPDSLQDDLRTARDALRDATLMRIEGAEALIEGLDAGGNVGSLADFERAGEAYQRFTIEGALGLETVVAAVGIEPDTTALPR